ncbi:hypothetical protein BDB00DRAFT_924487 [Zychaea mexicana]|uniref:uncharacterized protein n=1 Tax=Zychaea mexicana TaxID=64656 RepID=UPI0022FEFFC6|nr:uncharacterized protein BDB00DRAFT_924487 [Zychaea mexicana]KAI9499218.1 hypothetical protein BDB00DRAFT_924487 [Zychaea mexicana]
MISSSLSLTSLTVASSSNPVSTPALLLLKVNSGVDESKCTGDITYAPVVAYNVGQQQNQDNSNKQQQLQLQSKYLYWAVGGLGLDSSFGYQLKYTSEKNDDDSKKATTAVVEPFVLVTGSVLSYVSKDVAEGTVKSFTDNAEHDENLFTAGAHRIDCDYATEKKDQGANDHIQLSISEFTESYMFSLAVPIHQLVIPLDAHNAAEAETCAFSIAPLSTTATED